MRFVHDKTTTHARTLQMPAAYLFACALFSRCSRRSALELSCSEDRRVVFAQTTDDDGDYDFIIELQPRIQRPRVLINYRTRCCGRRRFPGPLLFRRAHRKCHRFGHLAVAIESTQQ